MNANVSKIVLPLIVILGLAIALSMGQWVAYGDMTKPLLIIGGMFSIVVLFSLGDRYWYLIPFGLMANLPAIPLGGRSISIPELGIIACTLIFIGRLILKREHLVIFRKTHWILLFCLAWILLCWSLNPTGLVWLGSSTMGGRSYIQIVLGVCAFFVMAGQRPTEKDFKWIFGLVLVGLVLTMFYGMVTYRFGGMSAEGFVKAGGGGLGEEGYTWHQVLVIPALTAAYLLFARYKPSEVFGLQRPWVAVGYGLLLLLMMFSGKRAGMAVILMVPLMSAFVYREYRYGIFAGIIMALVLLFAIQGHGTLFRLPYSMQRALSWVPGADFQDNSLDQGSKDIFREYMREFAIEEIKRNPIIGTGYALDVREMMSELNASMYLGGADAYRGFAVGKVWHNSILGYPATFGIPFGIAYMLLLLMLWYLSLRLSRRLPHPEMRQIFTIFVFFSVSVTLLRSDSSGFVASDIFENWWMYGLFFAIYAQIQREEAGELFQREQEKMKPFEGIAEVRRRRGMD